jgi:hypothetical protein
MRRQLCAAHDLPASFDPAGVRPGKSSNSKSSVGSVTTPIPVG